MEKGGSSSSSCNYNSKVCVTGGAGYIGSSLIKKLLNQGCFVHATLRNLNDHSKVQHLKGFNGAEERLKLFEADMYKAEEFEPAIQGCDFVFHVATPMMHTEGHKYDNRVDATVDAARSIAAACSRSGTVKRLIYTASVMAASPLFKDHIDHGSTGFKEFMDETCWTPLNLSIAYQNNFLEEYTRAKTLSEKEILSFDNSSGGMEVVTLACGLVGGQNTMPCMTGSVAVFLSPLTNDEFAYNSLKFLEELLAKIPIVHIEDVCNAHIFCMKQVSMSGRFLCANGYASSADIASYYQKKYPQYCVKKEYLEGPKREAKWGSSLLAEKGFEYKCHWNLVLDDCIGFARKLEILS